MFKINKCLFCFDLKYGFLAYGTILLIFRITAIMALWNTAFLNQNLGTKVHLESSVTMASIGYLAATTVALFIAIRGITYEKSILIYPYLVVSILELSGMVASNLWATFAISAWYLLYLTIGGGIELYVFICLLSLYTEIVERERNGRAHLSKGEVIALTA